MAGGQGSRLRPLTCDRPKPMVPVLNRPIMEHIVELLARSELRDVLVTLHPMPETVQQHFGSGEAWGVRLQYLVEESPLGTAGSVARARALVDDTLVVVSGDALTDVDLAEAVRFHRRRGALATLVLRPVGDPSEYGIVVTDPDGRVRRFLEKPGRGEVFSDHANTGIYVLEPEVLNRIEPGRPVDFSKDLFPALLAAGEPVYGFVTRAYWSDIGTPEQYRQAHLDVLERGLARILPEHPARGPGIWVGEGARISPGARLLAPCRIGPRCDVEAGAEIGPFACLGPGCQVARGATVRHSVLWSGCHLGPGAEVRGCVLADGVVVGRGARIYEAAVVGRRCRIGEGAVVGPGVRLWPDKQVDPFAHVSRPVVWSGSVSRTVVGPAGVRGLANSELTPEMACGVAGAFASTLPPGTPVVVAFAGAEPARALAWAAGAGVASAGCPVLWLGRASAPEARLAVQQAAASAAGLYVGVGREPEEEGTARLRLWDGRGVEIGSKQAREVDGAFRREEWRRASPQSVGAIRPAPQLREAARQLYLSRLAGWLEMLRSRLPWADGRGGAATPLPEGRVAVGVVAQQDASPGQELLAQALAMAGADVRLARQPAPEAVLFWAGVNDTAERLQLWDAAGRPLSRARVEELAARVGEPPTVAGCPDGVALACALAVRAAARGSLQALLAELPDRARLELEVPVPWDRLGRVMRRLAEHAGGRPQSAALPRDGQVQGAGVDGPAPYGELAGPRATGGGGDGLRFWHEQGWAQVRPDPDRPLLQLQVEAATLEDARELLGRYAAWVRQASSQP